MDVYTGLKSCDEDAGNIMTNSSNCSYCSLVLTEFDKPSSSLSLFFPFKRNTNGHKVYEKVSTSVIKGGGNKAGDVTQKAVYT